MQYFALEDASFRRRTRKMRMPKVLERIIALPPRKRPFSEIAPNYPKGKEAAPITTATRLHSVGVVW